MPETMKSRSPIPATRIASRLSLATKLYSIFALFAVLTAAITALSDYNTRRNAELTEADRDRQPRRAQRRARQFAGLCGGDGIPRRLHVDGTRRREEIWRGAAQVQRPDPRRGQELAIHRPGRRRRAVRRLQEAHRTVRRIPQGTGSPRRSRSVPPPAANGATTTPIATVRSALNKDLEALSKVYAERGKRIAAAGRGQPRTGLSADLSRRPRAGRWSASAS